MTEKPGIYELTETDYHADPAPEPSLSSSIATMLLDRSPRHAWTAHPRLNPNAEPVNRKEFDVGTAIHAMLLEGRAPFVIIDADNYRTKAAQAARNDAWAEGKTPLLADQLPEIEAAVDAAKAQLANFPGLDWGDDQPEQSGFWQEGDIWCRMRIDRLTKDALIDLKTTAGSANPYDWARNRMFDGPELQSGFYRRGARALGLPDRFIFIVLESKPPYALSVLELAPAALDHADKRARQAIDKWRTCLREDWWPGYPAQIQYVEMPTYIEYRREEQAANEAHAREYTDDLKKTMIDWQRPIAQAGE